MCVQILTAPTGGQNEEECCGLMFLSVVVNKFVISQNISLLFDSSNLIKVTE